MKIKHILLSCAIGAFGLSACTDGFDSLNDDQNKMKEADYDFSVVDMGRMIKLYGNYNYVLGNNALAGGGHLGERIKNMGIDAYAHYGTGGYTPDNSYQHDYWTAQYSSWISTLNGVIYNADQYPGRENSGAYARIWKVYMQSMFADYFGPSPFPLDALDDNPDYMALDKMHEALFDHLDKAMAGFTAESPAMEAKYDPMFRGDITRWKKFANTLRLRMAIKLSEINPELCKAQIALALKADGGLINEGEDALSPPYEDGWGNMYIYSVLSWKRFMMTHSMEYTLTDIGGMNFAGDATGVHPAKVDPRGTIMYSASPTDNNWQGMNPAMNNSTGVGVISSSMAPFFARDAQRSVRHMTYVEKCFLLAEAVERGLTTSGDAGGDAKTWYENGVKGSFAFFGIADKASDYLVSSARNKWGTSAKYGDNTSATGNTNLEKIVAQRYIAFYPDMSAQVWNDKRRLNLPAMEIPEYRDAGVGTWPTDGNIQNPANYIQRVTFPATEASNNTDKYNAGVALLGAGGDKVSTPLWWASKRANYCTSTMPSK